MTIERLFDKVEILLLYNHESSETLRALRELKKVVYAMRHIDPVLGCVITEPPAARPGQGEKYHG